MVDQRLTPEALRKRRDAVQAAVDKRTKTLGPLRKELEQLDGQRAKVRAKIAKENADQYEDQQELATLARALGARGMKAETGTYAEKA